MTSIVGHKPIFAVGEAMPEWAQFNWPAKIQHDIYRDWGTYYSSRRRENFSKYYFTQALELMDDDFVSLYRRSLTKSRLAEIVGALGDARLAADMSLKMRGPNCPMNVQICDSLFQLNKFEQCKNEICENLRRFTGNKSKVFETRRSVIDDVIKDTTNKSLSLFYLNEQETVKKVCAITREKEKVDDRPRWKILKDMGKCDILSIAEIEEEVLSPLEVARRKRAFNVVHQNYVNEAWKDFLFMKLLLKNPNLLLDYCKYSRDRAGPMSRIQYDVIRRFRQMLHSRSPIYYLNFMKFKNKKMLEKTKEATLFRIQYQTHRNMIADLKQIRLLRKEHKLEKLSDYIERVMGDYYVIKTNRVMCWKFEFMNEVYNTLALALCEQYKLPNKLPNTNLYLQLLKLLRVKQDNVKDVEQFVFGDRSTYQESEIIEPAILKARTLVTRLEKRNCFAKYSIEKCYLYHQIASSYLIQLRYDECILNARKAIKECRNCNSFIWQFLSILQIIKANVLQHKIENTKEAFEEIYPIVEKLKSKNMQHFIETCALCIEDEIRKKSESIANIRASKMSATSSFAASISSARTDTEDD